MAEDVGVMQARLLLAALYDEVESISRKLEVFERRHPRASAHGQARDHQNMSSLRRDLYDVHRLIDGIHRRFPGTLPESRQAQNAC